jgi:hypothetical protein
LLALTALKMLARKILRLQGLYITIILQAPALTLK